ncbi:H-type small acid-soluble spore protein [Bacillus lacus]|uniref:Small, acid-soluble spore protein H n=1 Tax=Metabacillus lacus TaxID=1983721 RepID=A0A7X2IXR1_9BACI|nr:H-type small acid-soluble spore protein [Metabacillus lacus]MRX71590.1 H-type small acid-soluble spore protein [Metabacillus lacus]
MNVRRASEISEMGDMIPVTFNGERVYIQHVDEAAGTARIYPLNNPQQETDVPVDQLQEQ